MLSRFLIILSLNLFRSNCSVGKPSISCRSRGGICQCQGRRVREVALHGVSHGAAMALAAAQARSGHNLRLLPHGFLDAAHPGEHEHLVEDFSNAANSVAFNTLADDIVGRVFFGP